MRCVLEGRGRSEDFDGAKEQDAWIRIHHGIAAEGMAVTISCRDGERVAVCTSSAHDNNSRERYGERQVASRPTPRFNQS